MAFVLNGDEQSQKLIIQACVPFRELMQKAHFAYRKYPSDNPYNFDAFEDNNKSYQRNINQERVKEIVKYLKSSILQSYKKNSVAVIFPTAMLLAFNADDTNYRVGMSCDLVLPYDVYIVDGQHRLYSMITLYKEVSESFLNEDSIIKEYLEHYAFNCTLMMNFDIWEQAQVFAEVNFNQKKVNKSLYYDIYGAEYPDNSSDKDKSFIYVAHQLVNFMNTTQISPFYHRIKMLGFGKGYFSQACFAEALMKHMSTPLGIWYISSNDNNITPNYRYMAVELISYFTCVESVFVEYWPKEYKHVSILCKTTGINAMVKLMGYIHKLLQTKYKSVFNELKTSKVYVFVPYIKIITPVLSSLLPSADKLFGLDGGYVGTGGSGLAAKLYKKMCEIINV